MAQRGGPEPAEPAEPGQPQASLPPMPSASSLHEDEESSQSGASRARVQADAIWPSTSKRCRRGHLAALTHRCLSSLELCAVKAVRTSSQLFVIVVLGENFRTPPP